MRAWQRATVAILALVLVACGAAEPKAAAPTTFRTTPATSGMPSPLLGQAGGAGQAIVVAVPNYRTAATASLTAYERRSEGWHEVFGPWPARIGLGGLARPGSKTEGDGRTPSGAYGFEFMFGVAADPGVKFSYRRVTSPSIVWDDDPSSPLYNQWVDQARQAAGAAPEPMYVSPAYDYGAVIAYNTARIPGAGSAIFLHVSTGGPTAGCISLPAAQLLEVLRWLDPARQPLIILGATAS